MRLRLTLVRVYKYNISRVALTVKPKRPVKSSCRLSHLSVYRSVCPASVLWVVIVEGEGAVLEVNLWCPIVTIGDCDAALPKLLRAGLVYFYPNVVLVVNSTILINR